MDHILGTDSRGQYAKPRSEELITKFESIKSALNLYGNLPTALETLSLLSKLQYLGEL